MKPITERIFLQFNLSDKEIADSISQSPPPVGVKIGKPSVIIKASDTGGVFVQLAIEFLNDSKEIGLAILATWIYDFFKKRHKKSCKINNRQILVSKRTVIRLIKNELKNQITRVKQRRSDKNRPPKKRS